MTTEKKIHARNQAIATIDLCNNLSYPEQWDNAIKTCYEMAGYVMELTNDVEEKNPFACFGRSPHPMDFEDADEFKLRFANYNEWEKNKKRTTAVTPK